MNKRHACFLSSIAVIFMIGILTFYPIHKAAPPGTEDVLSSASPPAAAANTGLLPNSMLSGINLGPDLSTMIGWLGTGLHDTASASAAEMSPAVGDNPSPPTENPAPVVIVTNPADRSTISKGTILTISATASDNQQVEEMCLYINENAKNRTDGDSITYTWDTGKASPGEYIIKATAWDGSQVGTKILALVVTEEQPGQDSVNDEAPTVPVASRGQTQVSKTPAKTDTSKYPILSPYRGSFGRFYYREASGGRIQVDPNWVAENIVTITLPGLNRQVQVHKNAKDRFIKAFTYIKNGSVTINGRKVPLLSLIETMDGTYVTRHVNWNPSSGLSNHSWGAAIDINAADHFRYVDAGDEPYDPNLILWEKAFKPAGFSWGNSYADSMHFELLD